LEEVTVRAGHQVFIEIDDHILPTVGDPNVILDLQLKLHLYKI
jgi:hypothetical protein